MYFKECERYINISHLWKNYSILFAESKFSKNLNILLFSKDKLNHFRFSELTLKKVLSKIAMDGYWLVFIESYKLF
jgi:hypothetical protein